MREGLPYNVTIDASYAKVTAQKNGTESQSGGCPLRLRFPCGKKEKKKKDARLNVKMGNPFYCCSCIPLCAPGAFSIKGMFMLAVSDVIKVTLLCNGKKAIFNN